MSDGDILTERHRGIRPGFGYPACPDHSEKFKLFELLGASELGINLTEHAAMTPAASVSGLYFVHPEARYFSVGRVGRRSDCRVCEAQGLQFRGCRALADLATGLRAGELLMAAGSGFQLGSHLTPGLSWPSACQVSISEQKFTTTLRHSIGLKGTFEA